MLSFLVPQVYPNAFSQSINIQTEISYEPSRAKIDLMLYEDSEVPIRLAPPLNCKTRFHLTKQVGDIAPRSDKVDVRAYLALYCSQMI